MRIALIGCGFFAQNHLHAWQDIEGAEIVAICDSDPVKLQQTGDAFGVAQRFKDASKLFEQGGFDVVDIATTVQSHRLLVEMAAKAGVHAICQKPFAETMDDAYAMVDAMGIAGKMLMVHENFRWQSAIRSTLEIVRSGQLGEPFFGRFSFRSGYDVFSGQPYLAEGERFIIEDLGIHVLDIARAFFGDVHSLYATTKRVNPAIHGEDVTTIMMTHNQGATSVVDCSYATKRDPETFPQTLIEIDGTQGSLSLTAGYKLQVTVDGRSRHIDLSPPILSWAQRPWHNIQESVLLMQQNFVDCIKHGRLPETHGSDNIKTLALVDAAYLSAERNQLIKLGD